MMHGTTNQAKEGICRAVHIATKGLAPRRRREEEEEEEEGEEGGGRRK